MEFQPFDTVNLASLGFAKGEHVVYVGKNVLHYRQTATVVVEHGLCDRVGIRFDDDDVRSVFWAYPESLLHIAGDNQRPVVDNFKISFDQVVEGITV